MAEEEKKPESAERQPRQEERSDRPPSRGPGGDDRGRGGPGGYRGGGGGGGYDRGRGGGGYDRGGRGGPRRGGPGGGRRFRRGKVCAYCVDKVHYIDYKEVERLRRYVTDRGKILPRRITGNCARHQRMLTVALKRARHIALLPFRAI